MLGQPKHGWNNPVYFIEQTSDLNEVSFEKYVAKESTSKAV